MEEIIKAEKLTKYYGEKESRFCVLRNLNFSIGKGEFVTVIGESGSGKSTLLNLLGLLDSYEEGNIVLNGFSSRDTTDKQRALFRGENIGFVFQKFNLISGLTVYDNIVMPFSIQKKKADDAVIDELTERLGIKELKNKRVDFLSGGESQRTAIARGLVCNPEIILADEPTGNLDSKNGDEVMEILVSLAREKKKTVVMVTHNVKYAKMADRCLTMRDGKLLQE